MDKATTDKCQKIVTQIMARTDSEPFREPVDWKVRKKRGDFMPAGRGQRNGAAAADS